MGLATRLRLEGYRQVNFRETVALCALVEAAQTN